MNRGFNERLTTAAKLETAFIDEFNKHSSRYKIIKYGIESTRLSEVHNFIRFCRDDTSKFVRYIPDSVLVDVSLNSNCQTTLIEFKAAITGIQKDSFLKMVRNKCPNMVPQFFSKEDIFNIEDDALNLYLKLTGIGIRVIVVVYAGFRTTGNKLLSQFVENIAKCNTYNPNAMGQNIGSGTIIANINLESFANIKDFFCNNYVISENIVTKVNNAVCQAFT